MKLGELWEYQVPFRHFRATGVLAPPVYDSVASRFTEILETTAGRRNGAYRLAISNPNYDALMLGMDEILAAEFAPLFSMEWVQELCTIFDMPLMPIIDGGLHSSPAGSRTGWIHTDFCAAWFDESMGRTGPFLYPRRDRCDYFTGNAIQASALPRKYVRAATMIFYLCNEGWTSGDGGETALYAAQDVSARSRIEYVPPLSNSLLLFECSPHSYHRFITNPGRTRNSIILWIHETPEFVASRWGLPI